MKDAKKCIRCGKSYSPTYNISQKEWDKQKYCTRECSYKDRVSIKNPQSEEGRKKMSLSKIGRNNPNYKENGTTLNALHRYMEKRVPKPKCCEICKIATPLDLANKGKYCRDVKEWYWLCRRCHMLSDGRMKNLSQYNEKK